MPDNINVEISTKKPIVAANLTELRYLVFQGLIGETGQSAYELAVELGFEGTEEEWLDSLVGPVGPAGAPGTTLGWDVTDDGEGNVEMTYPEAEFGDLNAVRFIQQTLTTAQQTQARENIGAASASDVDGLADTVEEQAAAIAENSGAILDQQEFTEQLNADENAVNVPRLSSFTSYGVTAVYNTTTEEYDLSGTATATFYHTASVGLISSMTAQKPPAGVYRLEITAYRANGTEEIPVNSTSVWGSLNCSKTGAVDATYSTDATGISREIMLDGDTMVDVRWHIAYGTVTDNMHIKVTLRRYGLSDIGKMLVGQADQMQGMKRKMLGVTRMLRYAYNTQKSLEKLFELPLVSDADNAVRSGYVMFARYNGDTFNTPYKQGVTDNMQAGAIAGFANASYAFQVALRYAAIPKLFVRCGTYNSSLNNGAGGYTFNSPWLLIQTTTA